MSDSISDEALKALVTAGSVQHLRVTRGPDGVGWMLQVRFVNGTHYVTLRSRREPARIFRTLDSAARYCESLGLYEFHAELRSNPSVTCDTHGYKGKYLGDA
ncbi:hypothetical protein [Pseudomonas citronellolis]|uniref:hypothetical protein n=1 Tax=Pseudomonas citronellolis TaxID=53408 RepID=UPI0023E41E3F|nr:hypothetical protein [Pseudomonas citronellolis]MDF3934766.1 hypothetical protein [Pseudomonas citronellolis]